MTPPPRRAHYFRVCVYCGRSPIAIAAFLKSAGSMSSRSTGPGPLLLRLAGPEWYWGTKKEDFLEGQLACPGDKEARLPGASLFLLRTKKEDCLEGQFTSCGDRRRISWRASLLVGTKKENVLPQ